MPIEVRNDVSPYVLGPLAYQSGLGEYGMRQADRMQQAQLAYDQMEQQRAMQANQIAAQQQAMMFQQAAGERDAYQRAMMGEWANQNQFGRQQYADERNFQQQGQYADYQSQLQDRSWENRLNAEGKAKLAESNRQKDLIESYDFANPRQKQEAMAQWTASQAGLKDPRYFMPEPLAFDEDIKQNGKEVDGGWIARKPDGSWYGINKPVDKDAITKQQIADRQASAKLEAETKLALEREKRRAAEATMQQKQWDHEQTRRDSIITQQTNFLKSQKVLGAGDQQVQKYDDEQIREMAEAEAYRRVPDSQKQWQDFESDYDAYRKFVSEQSGGTPEDNDLPEEFSDIPTRTKKNLIREEVEAWKEKYGPKQAAPQQAGGFAPTQNWQPSMPEADYAAEWNRKRPAQPWGNLPPEGKIQAAIMLDQERQYEGSVRPQQIKEVAQNAPIVRSKQEYDKLISEGKLTPGMPYIRDGVVKIVGG